MKLLSLICFITLTLLATNCKKVKIGNEDQLPPVTDTGANRIGAILNGKTWEAKLNATAILGNIYGARNKALTVNFAPAYQNGRIYIKAERFFTNNDSLRSSGFIIELDSFYNQNAVLINIADTRNGVDYFNGLGFTISSKDNSTIKSGTISFSKVDTIRHILAGTFAFNLSNSAGACTVSDGRFDLYYNQ